MNKLATTGLCAALAGAVLLTGCATYTGQTNDPNDPNRTRTGALIGAGIGAVAGQLTGDDAVERAQRARDFPAVRALMQQRMIVTGAGETRPIASNDTEAGRAQNRRVEITIVLVTG